MRVLLVLMALIASAHSAQAQKYTGMLNGMLPEPWLDFIIAEAAETADDMQLVIAYPFELAEVERLYTVAYYDGGGGAGLWFQLRNGDVFDIRGNRVSPGKGAFERPVTGSEGIRTAAYVMERLQGRQPNRKIPEQ